MNKERKIKDIMQRNIFTIHPDEHVFQASVFMASKDIGTLPVVKNDGTLIGIITDRDIVTRCNALGKDIHKAKVCECMTPNPIRTVPSDFCAAAMTLMGEYGIRRLPVIENDKLVGFVSIADIAKVSSHCQNEQYPNESCILIDIARELEKSSHCPNKSK